VLLPIRPEGRSSGTFSFSLFYSEPYQRVQQPGSITFRLPRHNTSSRLVTVSEKTDTKKETLILFIPGKKM
jgi:hypothetical protein